MMVNRICKSTQGRQFEEKVKDLLELLGYAVKRDVLIEGNQVDIVASKYDGPIGLSFLVECKDEVKPIGVNKIRQLHACIDAAQHHHPGIRGLCVSKRGFTKEAKATAGQLAIQCHSFEELEWSLMPCRPYLQWLVEDFEREFNGIYVDLHGDHHEDGRVVHYRPIDSFVDGWVRDKYRNHLSILGEYGTGKTTFCRHYAAKLARQYLEEPVSNRIPILINLCNFAKEMDVESLVTNHLVNKAGIRNVSFPIFRWMSERGFLVIILDGFDEMAQRTDADVTWSNFEAIADLVTPRSKIILTCRTEYFRTRQIEFEILRRIEKPRNFDMMYLQTLDDEQIKEYLRKRVYRDDPKADWKEYWAKITTIFDLHDLAIRPVLLNFIIAHLPDLISKRQEEIKASDLYKIAINKEIRRKLKRKPLIRPEDRMKLIQLLAAWMYENNQFFLHFQRVPEVLDIRTQFEVKLQRDIEYYLHDFLTCSFLSKDPDGNYRFSHKSFVDYFVARKLVEESYQGEPHNWSKYTLHREVARFIGEIASEDQTINNICDWAFDGGSDLRYNSATAITCMDSAKVMPYVRRRTGEIVNRSFLVWALGEIRYKSQEEQNEIFKILKNIVETGITHPWSWWMAAFAQQKLGKNSDPVQTLVKGLRKNKKFVISIERCFEEIEDPRSVVNILIHSEKALNAVRHKLVKAMKTFAEREKHPWRKAHNLCWLAGQQKIVELIPELVSFSEYELHDSTRNIATEALGKIGPVIGEAGFRAVLKRIRVSNERYYRTRYHAAEALRHIGRQEAVPELEAALSEEYEPIVRKEIKRSLAFLKSKGRKDEEI